MASRGGLSRATFAKLSPHPYLLANLEPADDQTAPGRSNGRAADEARPIAVQLSSLSHAHGSALVRIGDTTALCGVRGETLLMANAAGGGASPTATELMDHDLLVPNIELATGCAPDFLPGGPPTTLAQTLSTRIYSLLHSSRLLQPDQLRIWHTPPIDDAPAPDGDDMTSVEDQDGSRTANSYIAAYWVLYIDIFFISLDGNPFDAAWAATVAALGDTKLPRARYDADRQRVVCVRHPSPRPLTLTGLPVACTAVVFTGKETDRPTDGKHWLLVDPDRLEESLCDESLTVVVDFRQHQMKILSIAKQGGLLITTRHLRSPELWAWASKRWKDTAAALQGPDRIAG